MESKWKKVNIDSIKSVQKYGCVGGPFGSSLSRKHYVENSGVPIIRGVNLSGDVFREENFVFVSEKKADELHRNLAHANDIVFTQRGTLGQVALIPDKPKYTRYVVSQSQMRLTVDLEKADPYYVFSYFRLDSVKKRIEKSAIVGGVPHTNLGILKAFEIDLPPLAIQKKISEVVSNLDKKITINNQTNQTLEQMAQTLFKSWFIDFDPVFDNLLAKADFKLENLASDFPESLLKRAKQRLLALDDKAKTALSSANLSSKVKSPEETLSEEASQTNIHKHFPSEFEQTDDPTIGISGWIPKGWALSNTGNEFQIKGGSTPSTKNPDFWDGGEIHWTSPKDLSGNDTKIMLDTNRKITEQGLTKITSGLLPIDTVLMSSRAPVGYLALAKIPVAINQGYIAITDAKTLSSEYTIQWLESVMDEIKSISGGTTFAEISKKTFKSIQIIIPNKETVDAYTAFAKANYQRITANVQEINTLTETRDYLLPKLISGEITLPDNQLSSET
ncbi:restriction endonuclease subunit S [Colwellia sp. 6_MG-2023]|uniref:restriction endonuclease subunit S n=1 Tax=Colwellia sp. 6_MG-2023 TaxID=3062676 RepID=UPI0026E23009|nr:restriction endonuclease subunit S [Colwellia sp. 6_MG-2023]MDO6488430.1 restriction endonuclease subunit S [Colwellia sp. 6_MG-2023]